MSEGAKRQQFTKEFKDDAVRLVLEQGTTVGRQIFQASKQTYGSPRVVRELEKAGYNVGRYQVRSLIRRLGLRAKTPRRYKVTTDSNHKNPGVLPLTRICCCSRFRKWRVFFLQTH